MALSPGINEAVASAQATRTDEMPNGKDKKPPKKTDHSRGDKARKQLGVIDPFSARKPFKPMESHPHPALYKV